MTDFHFCFWNPVLCTIFLLFNLVLSALGLRCCELAFSSPGKWELFSSCFSLPWFPLRRMGSRVCGLRLRCAGLVALQPVGSSWDRIKPVSPALAGRLPTTGLPGKPYNILNLVPTGQSDGSADVSFILLLSQLPWSFTVLASANPQPCFSQFVHQTLAQLHPHQTLFYAWDFHFYTFSSVYKFLFAEDSYFPNG